MHDEKEKAENAVTALEKVQTDIADAIAKTKSFVDDLLANIGTTDAQFEKNFNNLINQINDYKKSMKDIYDSVDTTLRQHGYNKDINLKAQFANTIDDFGDSTMLNTFPYIPSRYIYQGDTLNERILHGIFSKDVKDISINQIDHLADVVDRISQQDDLKSMGKFIGAGYIKGFSYNPIGTGKVVEDRSYNLSDSFKNFSSLYYLKYQLKAVNSIVSGISVRGLSSGTMKGLQIGALLSNIPSSRRIIIGDKEDGFGKEDLDLDFKIERGTLAGSTGLKISIPGLASWADVWSKDTSEMFVSDFIADLGFRFDAMQTAGFEEDAKINILNSVGNILSETAKSELQGQLLSSIIEAATKNAANELGDKLSSWVGIATSLISNTVGEYDKYREANENLNISLMKEKFNVFTYGGILVKNYKGKYVLDHNILDLNGTNGFGVTAEAYNYYNSDKTPISNISGNYSSLMNPNDPNYQTAENNLNTIKKWVQAEGRTVTSAYQNAIVAVGRDHGISIGGNVDYKTYEYVIETWPDEIKAEFERAEANEKRES